MGTTGEASGHVLIERTCCTAPSEEPDLGGVSRPEYWWYGEKVDKERKQSRRDLHTRITTRFSAKADGAIDAVDSD